VDSVAQLILVAYQRVFTNENKQVSLAQKSVAVIDATISQFTQPLSNVAAVLRYVAGALVHPSLAFYDGEARENRPQFSEAMLYQRFHELRENNIGGRLGLDAEGKSLTIEKSDWVVQDFLQLYHACNTPEERIEFLSSISVCAKSYEEERIPSHYETTREQYLTKKYIHEFIQTGAMNALEQADTYFVIRHRDLYFSQKTFTHIQESVQGLLEAQRLPQLLAYFNAHQTLDSNVSEVEAINQLNCGFQLIASGSSMALKFTTQKVTLTQWMLSLACVHKFQIADIDFNEATPILMNISYESLKNAKSIRISHPTNLREAWDFYDHEKSKKFNRLEHFEIDFGNQKHLWTPGFSLHHFESVAPNLRMLRYKNFPGKINEVKRIDALVTSCPKLEEVELPLDPELLATCQATYPQIRWTSITC
jgi:hypothetical protein